MTGTAMAMPTRRVDMRYEGTEPQARLTVGFRIILAIPHVIVLWFLFVAMVVVAVIGWFAALFMGRLPEWAHTFISGGLRWYTRVGAYLLLLTDRYPPFSLDDEAYPARPFFPAPGPLNRWAVLFRFILAIPAGVFYNIVSYGLSVPLLLVMWFVVLIRGTMPAPLYTAYAALLRYQVRFHAYFAMLTSEYAWGMLGDQPAAAPLVAAPPPPPPFPTPQPPAPSSPGTPAAAPGSPPQPTPQPYAYPSPTEQTTGAAPSDAPGPEPEPEPPAAAPDVAGPSEPAAPRWPPPMPSSPVPAPPPPTGLGAMPPPSPWERVVPSLPAADETPPWATLVLTGAARGWMIFAIVWGSILFVGQSIAQNAARHHRHTSAQQVNRVVSDYAATSTALHQADSSSLTCATVACLRPSHLRAASMLTRFDADLRGMSLPPDAGQPAQVVESDTGQLASILTQMANSANLSAYRSRGRSSNLGTILNSYPGDYHSLVTVMRSDLG